MADRGEAGSKASAALGLLGELSRRAPGLTPDARARMGEALAELTTTLEELRAIGEELSEANAGLERTQAALRKSRKAYQELFDLAPDGYLITDPYGMILMANATVVRRLAGGAPEQLLGKPLTVIIAPDDRTGFFVALQRARRTRARTEWLGRVMPRAAPAFSAELVVVGRPDGDEEATDLLWLLRDRTEREQYESALTASELAFRTLAENSPDPIMRLDGSLRMTYANAATERLTGRAGHELLGARLDDLGLADEGVGTWAAAASGAARGLQQAVELPFDGPAGRRWLESLLVPERGPGGEVERLLVVSRDVTDRRRAAQDLRESGNLKNAMLATVSHELRTPLTAIAAAAEALAGATGAESSEMIDLITGETGRLERMVGNLLDLSRLQGRALIPRLEPFPVETLVGSALAAVGGALDDAEVAVELSDDAALVMIDPMMAERILVNLLHNAMTHGAPPLRLASRVADGRVELSVSDSGPGVPEGDELRIFLPFVHGGSPGSAGIGLALALAFAETQGAVLALRREAGAGACFVLSLPPAELEPMPDFDEAPAATDARPR